MISEFDTLNQDPKKFIDPKKTLGDIGVQLTQADIDNIPAEEVEEEAGQENA